MNLQIGSFSKYSIFAQRIGLVGLAQTALKFKGLIILSIIAKTLGVGDYGFWSLIMVSISLLQPILLLGLGSSLLRFHSSENKKQIVTGLITGLSLVLFTGIVASIFLYLFSLYLSDVFFSNNLALSVIRISLIFLVISSLNELTLSSFRIFGLIKKYATILLVQTFLEITLVAILVFWGYGLVGALFSLVVVSTIILVIQLSIIISYAGFSYPNFLKIKPYLKYGLPLVPTTIFSFVIASSDRYVIGFFMGANDVGIYSAAYGIGSIILMFSSYLNYILRPTIYNLFDNKQYRDVKKYLSHSTKYLLLISIPSAFGLSILARPILLTVTTNEFVHMGVLIIPIVAFSTVLYGIELNYGTILMVYNNTKIFPIIAGVIALINLGLNIIVVPYLGITGAALTTLLAYVLLLFSVFFISRKFLKFNLDSMVIGKCIIASFLMTIIIWLINPIGFFSTVVTIFLGAIIYFSLLIMLKGISIDEIKSIMSMVNLKKYN